MVPSPPPPAETERLLVFEVAEIEKTLPPSRYGVSCIMRARQMKGRGENSRLGTELYIPISVYTEP